MKVLHLSSERTWRGGEQQIAYLIEELEKLNHNNFVICKKGSAFEKYCLNFGIEYLAVPFAGEWDLFTAYEIKNFCSYFNIDIIHAHSSHSHAMSVYANILGAKTPVILSRRVDFPVGRTIFSRFKYNHGSIKKIICVSDCIKSIMVNSVYRPSRCLTIHDGIDLTKFSGTERNPGIREQLGIGKNQKIVGNISAIAPHKDYYTFIDTAEKVFSRRNDIVFLIVGDGPDFHKIQNYAKNKNLSGKIIFTGFRNDVIQIMPELDVFLMTSKTEGLGTTLLDAASCNIPIVATRAGGIPEIIEDGISGLLADVGDSDRLAENVLKIIDDRDLKESIIKGAQIKVKSFSKETMARSTLSVYESIIKKSR